MLDEISSDGLSFEIYDLPFVGGRTGLIAFNLVLLGAPREEKDGDIVEIARPSHPHPPSTSRIPKVSKLTPIGPQCTPHDNSLPHARRSAPALPHLRHFDAPALALALAVLLDDSHRILATALHKLPLAAPRRVRLPSGEQQVEPWGCVEVWSVCVVGSRGVEGGDDRGGKQRPSQDGCNPIDRCIVLVVLTRGIYSTGSSREGQ